MSDDYRTEVVTWVEAEEELRHLYPEYDWQVRWVHQGEYTSIEFTLWRDELLWMHIYSEEMVKYIASQEDESVIAVLGRGIVDVFERNH